MQPSPELEAIARRFLRGRKASDFETVRSLTSLSEHVLAIGSADHEWIQGGEGVREAIEGSWTGEIAEDEILRIQAIENGETGWVGVEGERTSATGVVYRWRGTFVFHLDAGTWRIAHSHFSLPVPNAVTEGGVLTRTLSDLLTSMPAEASAEGRTRTVTVVFSDIVDSTALSQTMSGAAWSELLDEHFEMLDDIVTGAGGTVVKTVGDGGLFVFSSAGSALQASASIQRLATTDGRLPVRIGVHSGDVVTSDDDVIGVTVSKAARVASTADGGQILASSVTAGMVNGYEFDFSPPKSVELKGLAGTHQLHELRWE